MKNINDEHSKYAKLLYFTHGDTSITNKSLAEQQVQRLLKIDRSVFENPYSKFLDPCAGTGTFGVVLFNVLSKYHEKQWILENMIFMVDTLKTNCDILSELGFINIYNEDFLKLDLKMKFDVVVGNFPFQDSNDTGGLLWDKFAKKTSEILKIGGYKSVIHPPSFIGKHMIPKKGKTDYSTFANSQIKEIHIFDDFQKEKYFKGVGSKICWYISQNIPFYEDTKIVSYDHGKIFTYSTDFLKLKILPQTLNKISLGIHEKLIKSKSLDLKFSRELHYHTMKRKNQVRDTHSEEFPYVSYFSHKITRFSNFMFSDYDAIKVMIPQTSTISKSFKGVNCNVSEDLFYTICETDTQAVGIIEMLNSPIVEYIGKMYRNGRNLGFVLKSGLIPNNLQDLNLTEEEIDYINSYVE
jgi:hypothetical protein